MKTRNLVAGGIVGALALGIWLGSFWKGPGLGGSGTGFGISSETGTGERAGELKTVSPDAAVSSNIPEGRPIERTIADPEADKPREMLTILIDGNHFQQLGNDFQTGGKVLTLTEVLDRAKATTGTPEGIRVRILKTRRAQEGARADLMKNLAENGIKREEIQERGDFID